MDQGGARHLLVFGVDNLQGILEACPDVEVAKGLHDFALVPTCRIELREMRGSRAETAETDSGNDVIIPGQVASHKDSYDSYDSLYRETAVLHDINTLGPLPSGLYKLSLENCYGKSFEAVHTLVVNPKEFVFDLRDDGSVFVAGGGADESPPGVPAINFSFTALANEKEVTAHENGAYSLLTNISTSQLSLFSSSQILSATTASSAFPFLAAGASLVMIVLSVFALAVCAVVCIRQIEHMPSRRRRARLDVKARVLESRGSKPSSQPGTPRASEMKELLTKFETAQNEEDGCTQETNPSLGEFW